MFCPPGRTGAHGEPQFEEALKSPDLKRCSLGLSLACIWHPHVREQHADHNTLPCLPSRFNLLQRNFIDMSQWCFKLSALNPLIKVLFPTHFAENPRATSVPHLFQASKAWPMRLTLILNRKVCLKVLFLLPVPILYIYQPHASVLYLLRLAPSLWHHRRCWVQPLLSRLFLANQGFTGQASWAYGNDYKKGTS